MQVDVGQEAALGHLLAGQPEAVGVGPHDAPLELEVEVAHGWRNSRIGVAPTTVGIVSTIRSKSSWVRPKANTKLLSLLALRLLDVLDRLHALEDDVGGPQLGDLPLRLEARPLGDGQHRDDRRDAEDQAQDREEGPHLVQREVADRQRHREEIPSHGCGAPAWCEFAESMRRPILTFSPGRRCPEGADEGLDIAIDIPPVGLWLMWKAGDPHPAVPATFSRGEKVKMAGKRLSLATSGPLPWGRPSPCRVGRLRRLVELELGDRPGARRRA